MIKDILCNNKEKYINIRRKLHKYPELAFEEYKTSAFIAEYLKELGLSVTENVAKTGVVGVLYGKEPGKTLLLRADMDALPLTEINKFDFVSQNKGVMHACGHDIHMTTLLAAATVLCELKDKIKGNIKFVFQPAEEGNGGAEPMIDEGVLENPKVDAAFAYHISDAVPTGSVMLKSGGIMASPDHFYITIHGKGGHGATPEICINPVQIACESVLKIHEIKTIEPSVISICTFNGGTFENIIPDSVVIKGTARTTDKETRQAVYEAICKIVNETAEKYGGRADIDYHFLYPPCINDQNMTELFKKTSSKVLGSENVHIQEKSDMIGEDFAYFAEKVPSCFVKLGGALRPLHTSDFNADEEAIFVGANLMAEFALDYLNQ